jgi:Zn-dependent protease with chaperone function
MYFTNPIKKFEARSSGLMDTHPAILDRINRLRTLTGEGPLEASEAASLAGLD